MLYSYHITALSCTTPFRIRLPTCGTSYQLSLNTRSTSLAQFRSRLNGAEFLGSQCATSAWMRRSTCTHLVVSRACEINDKTAIFA